MLIKKSLIKGTTFGLTSGIITTIGLIVGLHSGTGSKEVVIAGILTIAIADAFSDALGVHISEESDEDNSDQHVWESTFATFLSKLIFASTFMVPMLLFEYFTGLILSLVWGILSLSILSYLIAVQKKEKPISVIGEHLLIAVVVIVLTYLTGGFIKGMFS